MEILLELLQDVLSWACIGALAWIVLQIKSILKHNKLQEEATKSLMRADLIRRYKEYRDNGNYCTDEHKDQYCRDVETYHALAGGNGYIDKSVEEVMAMPTEPQE